MEENTQVVVEESKGKVMVFELDDEVVFDTALATCQTSVQHI